MAKDPAPADGEAVPAAELQRRKKISEQKFWEAARAQKQKKTTRLIVIGLGVVLGGGVAAGAAVYGRQLLAPTAPVRVPVAAASTPQQPPRGPQPITGPATVVDGGTLTVGGRTIRLQGVSAPPVSLVCRSAATEYRCGEVARRVLEYFAGSTAVACLPAPGAAAGPAVAVCRNQRGFDLASLQVEAGWAIVAGGSPYSAEQTRAQTKEAGLWRGSFAQPDLWAKGASR